MDENISIDDQFINVINQHIENNIDNENFSVEELARLAGLSRSMLHRKLKKVIGQSPSEYITAKRLNHAKILLENDVATVSEIAYRVGFSDPSYFNKVFKKHFNLSPGKIRDGQQVNRKWINFRTDIFGIKLIIPIIFFILIGGGAYYIFLYNKHHERSIAVLPLHNLTGNTENKYLVDGIHDALIGELGSIKSLRVISRTSTLRYRNSDLLLETIARELGVNTIVEGSVIDADDSLRVLIQLIDVFPEESHLLAKEYNNDMQNVLNIQSEAARDIVQNIRVKLSKEEENLLNRSRTVDSETYKDYLRGMFYFNQGTAESFEIGLQYMLEVIKRDPGDAFAYGALALAYALKGHGMITPIESFRSAEAAAERALKINPTMDEAYTALGLIYLYQHWDWTKAKVAFEHSLSHNPNNAIAHAHYAFYHFLYGNKEKALYHAETAVVLEPLSASYNSWLAIFYYYYQDYENTEKFSKKALELKEDIPYGNLALGWIYLKNKQFGKAIELHNQLPKYGDYYKLFLSYTYVKSGNRDKALAIWNDWEESAGDKWVNPFHRGMVAGMLGFDDKAFELLNIAIENKYYPSNYIQLFPSVEFIRNDPRYNILLQKLNLPYRTRLATKP